MSETNHLILDSITDLLKISPDKLKTIHYSDLSGKYFEQINKEVINSEKNLKPKKEKRNQILDKYELNNNIVNISQESNRHFPQSGITFINKKEKNKIGYVLNKNNPVPIFGYNNHEINEEEIYPIKKIIFSLHYNTLFGQEIAIAGSNNKLGKWDKNNLFFLNWTEGNNWVGVLDIDEEYEDFEFKFVLCNNKNIICWEPGENNNVYFSALLNEIKEFQKGKFNKYEYEYNQEDGELTLYCHWPR